MYMHLFLLSQKPAILKAFSLLYILTGVYCFDYLNDLRIPKLLSSPAETKGYG